MKQSRDLNSEFITPIETQINNGINPHIEQKANKSNIIIIAIGIGIAIDVIIILIFLGLYINYSSQYNDMNIKTLHLQNQDATINKQINDIQIEVNTLRVSNIEIKEKNNNIFAMIAKLNSNNNETLSLKNTLELDKKNIKNKLDFQSIVIGELHSKLKDNKETIVDLEALEELDYRVSNRLRSQIVFLKKKLEDKYKSK